MEKKDKYYSYIESRILKAYYKVSNVVGFVPICIRQHNRKINNLTIHLKVKYLYKNISSVVVFRVVYLCRRYGKNLSRFEQQKKSTSERGGNISKTAIFSELFYAKHVL